MKTILKEQVGYDGRPKAIEVLSFNKDIHNNPGVYLQRVEGCGYEVWEMTPEEAESVAKHLLQAAKDSLKSFGYDKK
jgi:hypothetical protein